MPRPLLLTALLGACRGTPAYRVVIQHVPVPPPGGSRLPELEPSHADTVHVYVAAGAPRS